MTCDGSNSNRQRRGAVVLCGGGSERMGRDKAWLPFGEETMLQRVVRLVGSVVPVANIVVVSGVGQDLPPLPGGVRIVGDRETGQGPVPAVIDGLQELEADADAALVTSCDAPLLDPGVAEYLFEQLDEGRLAENGAPADAIIPSESTRMYPLAGVYLTSCWMGLDVANVRNRLKGRSESMQGAINSDGINALLLPIEELRELDPSLHTLLNCNTPAEYQAALAVLEAQRAGS